MSLSIQKFLGSLTKRRHQRLDKYYVVFESESTALRSAMRNNGFFTRDFAEELSTRVTNVTVPDVGVYTTEITESSGLQYSQPYGYNIADTFSFNVMLDKFGRFHSVFNDWLRLSVGINSAGQIPYRNQANCDFTIVAIGENGEANSGYRLKDCIIKSVSGLQFANDTNTLAEATITLSPRFLEKLNSLQASIVYRSNS